MARKLRAARNQTPILMLTARDATHDMVEGLNLGADDYLVKPFSFEVLLARLRAVSRRGAIAQPPVLQVADLSLDPAAREVIRGGRKIALTRTEYGLLELLMKRAGRVVTRENLIESVWGFDSDVRSNTLDAFIRLLRDKVDTEGETKLIQTVRGVGYCLRAGGRVMRHWSIGARLTLWYSLVLLAGLALFGAGIWVVVNHQPAWRPSMRRWPRRPRASLPFLQTEYEPSQAGTFAGRIVRIRGGDTGRPFDRGAGCARRNR